MATFKIWAYSLLTVIILGLVIYSVYIGKHQIDNLINGIIWPIGLLLYAIIWCLIVLVIAGSVLAISYGVVFILKHLNTTEISEIGQYGNMLVKNGRHTVVKPYYPNDKPMLNRQSRKALEAPKINVPSMTELLEQGTLYELLERGLMLLGYNQQQEESTGTMNDVRTSLIAGKSRSGKTVSMAYYTLQYVISKADVYIIDKWANKPGSLSKLLHPLKEAGYIQIAETQLEIDTMIQEVHDLFQSNKEAHDKNVMYTPTLFIVDEWTDVISDKETKDVLLPLVQTIARVGAAFNWYAMIGGHNWQPSQAGSKAFLSNIQSKLVHKIVYEESKLLLPKHAALHTPKLKTGSGFFKNTEDEIEELIIPLTTVYDSELVLKYMQQLEQEFFNPSHDAYLPALPATQQKMLHKHIEDDMHDMPTIPDIEEQITTFPLEADIPVTSMPVAHMQMATNGLADIISEDGSIVVKPSEQLLIAKAIEQAKQAGKVHSNGKVVKGAVQELLQWNNRQRDKLKLYCDVKGY